MLSPFTVPALEGTAGPVTLNDPVFISDLHLSHSEPDTINAFLRFLEHEAAEHAELLILGDFFDYWIGDDASYTMAAVADALRAYSASHGLYIMHGNRDFMMGERFAREIGATLLRDPAVGVLRGERILLSHGDLWCTFDADYQKVRRRVRSVWWQWIMLRLPLKKRLQVAEDARARSRTRKSVKAAYITDVDERALDEAARNLEAAVVIHGHTHRPGITTTAGGVIHPLHTKPEEGYFYADRARIEACITPKTKAIMITNPGNPTGTCLTEAQMKMLLDVAVAHDLYLVADEVYREFTYDGEPLHSFGKFDYGQENLILIDSVSKRFSACGARIGCLISRNREFMANALKYCQARLSVATLDQIAAAALYSVGPEYFEQVRQEYKRRRDTVVRKLHEIPGVICECPRGAFYLMAALPVDDAEKFQLWLLQEFEDHGDTVMFSAGEPFYATPGKGRSEIRIAYVLKQEDLERAMDLLALGIRKYNETH